jgi:hypothetical protein
LTQISWQHDHPVPNPLAAEIDWLNHALPTRQQLRILSSPIGERALRRAIVLVREDHGNELLVTQLVLCTSCVSAPRRAAGEK